MLVIVIGITISLVFPPAAICLIIGLIVIGKIKCDECEPHEEVLREFASTRNWYYEPQTELRRVQGRAKRVRFYAAAALLSADAVANRLISNDFVPRTPPSAGEVPRKQPPSRVSSPAASRHHEVNSPQHTAPTSSPTPHFKIHWAPILDEQKPPPVQDHIPPAGWNPTPITPFLHEGLRDATEIPTAGRTAPSITPTISHTASPNRAVEIDPMPSASLEQQRPNKKAEKTPRQRKPRTLGEVAAQSVFDLSPAQEGGRKQKTHYAKVRSAKLRKAAIEIHGRDCCACTKNFDEIYGPELAKGYVEIHHLNKIAAGERTTDPATDLAPLCSNCHRMADRLSPPPRTIAELRYQLFPEFRLQENEVALAAKANKSPVKIRIGKIREKKPKKDS